MSYRLIGIRPLGAVTAAVTLLVGAAACGGDQAGGAKELKGQAIEVVAIWSGDEQQAFEKILDVFEKKTGVNVRYTSAGDDLPTLLQTRIQGNNAPNLAILAQPGLVVQFGKSGALKPVSKDVADLVSQNYSSIWKRLGTVDNNLYAVYFKAANKSTFWYNEPILNRSGLKPPKTWDEFLSVSKTLADSGVAPVAIGAADGWVLTDWFENVYLQTAGGEMYDKLSHHEIPWTDPSVRKALGVLQQFFRQPQLISGGNSGALLTEFADSVVKVFGRDAKAVMVYEADFVANVIRGNTQAKVGEDARFFPFPTIGQAPASAITGGDAAVALRDDKATMELLKFLASPESGIEWAKLGGFLSPNKNVALESYPDELTRGIAKQLLDAGDNIRYDMSDLYPAQFGATRGAGEWKAMQDFFGNPNDIDGVMRRLETDAAKAATK